MTDEKLPDHIAKTRSLGTLKGYHFLAPVADAAGEAEALRADAGRYRWLRAKWDANTDSDLEQFDDAMNSADPDAAIDAARTALTAAERS